jgi:phosphatidylserine/phosphatidylglycerophosphate/cardiolipin synthase-like enzyme
LTDDEILVELVRARRRGVDVRVVVPSGDTIMDASNVVATNLLVRNGVRVYVYPGPIHGKAAIFDGWACFGSANMDDLSLRVNQEVNLATSSPEVVAELRERLFERDFARSREIVEPRPVGWDAYVLDFLAEQL